MLGGVIELGEKMYNAVDSHLRSQGEFFAQSPFEDCGTIAEGANLPMLGNSKHDNTSTAFLSEDAAALCQYVYYKNELRVGDQPYNTKTKSWYMYDPKKDSHLNNFIDNKNNNGGIDKKYSNYGYGFGLLSKGRSTPSEMFNEVKDRLIRKRIGFGSRIFYKLKGNQVTDIAYVTEGSGSPMELSSEKETMLKRFYERLEKGYDRLCDWTLNNTLQAICFGIAPQYTLAAQNAKVLDTICHKKNVNLYFFGHSLGGGMATSNAIATDRPAIVFDMAGLNFFRLLKNKPTYDKLIKEKKILSYYYEGEFLSSGIWSVLMLKHNGNRYKIKNDEYKPAFFNRIFGDTDLHALDKICKRFGLKPMQDKNSEVI